MMDEYPGKWDNLDMYDHYIEVYRFKVKAIFGNNDMLISIFPGTYIEVNYK
jgi:hypothetical protein